MITCDAGLFQRCCHIALSFHGTAMEVTSATSRSSKSAATQAQTTLNSVWVVGPGVVRQACEPSFGRLKEEDREFKSSLCYMRPCLKTNQNKIWMAGLKGCVPGTIGSWPHPFADTLASSEDLGTQPRGSAVSLAYFGCPGPSAMYWCLVASAGQLLRYHR